MAQAPLWSHPTSRSQTAFPEFQRILHSFTYFLSGQTLDLGPRYRESPISTAILRLSGGGICFSSASPNNFAFECSDTFPWETLKDKFGFNFFKHFLHCHHQWEHGPSQRASAESPGAPGSHFQTFSPLTTAGERRRITVGSQEQTGSSNMTMDLSPSSSPLPQLCNQREINPHPNNLITQGP